MNNIISKIEELHTNSNGIRDDEQLEVIFSSDRRIIVEAPAGYGKTRTMISKIAYLIATNQVSNPKKILTLTFSVNAAYKIKRDIAEKLPDILHDSFKSPVNLKKKIFASNYHGFCRRILKLYGYLISSHLAQIDDLKGTDDSEYHLKRLSINLEPRIISELSQFGEKVKECDANYIEANFRPYLEKVIDNLLPEGYIPFNAILLFALSLFEDYPGILKFYKNYFPIIIIDEYQDTNLLSKMILDKLIDNFTQLVIMGDPLQRIYGFIGAIPSIMSISEQEYSMRLIKLETNHRFADNPKMVQLDQNIRGNAEDIQNPKIDQLAEVDLFESVNQRKESRTILKLTNAILRDHPTDNVAILVRAWRNNKNTELILKKFDGSINYFNALFSDDDEEYIEFHQKALNELINLLKNTQRLNIVSSRLYTQLENHYSRDPRPIFKSLLKLLKSFLKVLSEEYTFLSTTEKLEFIKDTLENRALKQYLENVDSNVVLTTIHGAKGLEWEHIIIADVEETSFPSWIGLCKKCKFKTTCIIDWNLADPDFINLFYEELSVFYVAATRAKKQTIFSYSKSSVERWQKKKISCFLKLEGINPKIHS
jgi:DNA helicase-2/ATP-dependent DNA helicase PcrA